MIRKADLWQDSMYASSSIRILKACTRTVSCSHYSCRKLNSDSPPRYLTQISLQVGSKQAAVLWKQLVSETKRNLRAQMMHCIALFISLVKGGVFRQPSRTNPLCNRWSQKRNLEISCKPFTFPFIALSKVWFLSRCSVPRPISARSEWRATPNWSCSCS